MVVEANVMNISVKFQLHPLYGFWGDNLLIFFHKFNVFWLPWQPIKFSSLDKIRMLGRGLLKEHFCKTVEQVPGGARIPPDRQNHCTTKYRSLTCIYFMRSIFVSHWFISPNMMFIHQIAFKILRKITDTKYRSLTYIFYKVNLYVTLIHYIKYDLHPSNSLQDIRQNHWTMNYRSQNHLCVTLIHYPKYNICPSNSLQVIEQNHWTMKYRSLTYIYFMRSIFVSHWSIIQCMTFNHQIVFKI